MRNETCFFCEIKDESVTSLLGLVKIRYLVKFASLANKKTQHPRPFQTSNLHTLENPLNLCLLLWPRLGGGGVTAKVRFSSFHNYYSSNGTCKKQDSLRHWCSPVLRKSLYNWGHQKRDSLFAKISKKDFRINSSGKYCPYNTCRYVSGSSTLGNRQGLDNKNRAFL